MDFSPTPELIEEELRRAIRERDRARAAFERSVTGGAHRMTMSEHAMAVDSVQSFWDRWQAAESRVTELIRMAGPELALRVVADEEGKSAENRL